MKDVRVKIFKFNKNHYFDYKKKFIRDNKELSPQEIYNLILKNIKNMDKIVFRMDDVGASTKLYEVYSNKYFGNLFLKRMKYFKAWGHIKK